MSIVIVYKRGLFVTSHKYRVRSCLHEVQNFSARQELISEQSQLLQLGEAMKKWREEIWTDKKLYPGGPKDYDVSSCTELFFEMAYIEEVFLKPFDFFWEEMLSRSTSIGL